MEAAHSDGIGSFTLTWERPLAWPVVARTMDTLLALRAVQRYALPDNFQLELLARLDNATDKAYAGSVIVNDTPAAAAGRP